MLSASEIKAKIGAYASGAISLGDFEDWFYEASVDPPNAECEDTAALIDAILSARHFEKLSQRELRARLQGVANTIHPFVYSVVSVLLEPMRDSHIYAFAFPVLNAGAVQFAAKIADPDRSIVQRPPSFSSPVGP